MKTNGNNININITTTTNTTATNNHMNYNETYNLYKTAYNQKSQPKYKKNSKIVPYTHIQLNKSSSKAKDDGKEDEKNTLSGFKVVAKYFYTCHKCNLDFNSLKIYQQHLLTHGQTPGKILNNNKYFKIKLYFFRHEYLLSYLW